MAQQPALPETGFVRLTSILAPFGPIPTSEQTIRVQHVTVKDGGQAVVAGEVHTGARKQPLGEG